MSAAGIFEVRMRAVLPADEMRRHEARARTAPLGAYAVVADVWREEGHWRWAVRLREGGAVRYTRYWRNVAGLVVAMLASARDEPADEDEMVVFSRQCRVIGDLARERQKQMAARAALEAANGAV